MNSWRVAAATFMVSTAAFWLLVAIYHLMANR